MTNPNTEVGFDKRDKGVYEVVSEYAPYTHFGRVSNFDGEWVPQDAKGGFLPAEKTRRAAAAALVRKQLEV